MLTTRRRKKKAEKERARIAKAARKAQKKAPAQATSKVSGEERDGGQANA
jgi:hypothetical protein